MYVTTNKCESRAECIKKCPTEAIRLIKGNAFSCITCGTCHDVCPNNAIFKNSYGGYVVDRAKCNGCGICEYSCPVESIHIEDGIVKGICSMCGLCGDVCESRIDASNLIDENRLSFLNSLKLAMPNVSDVNVPIQSNKSDKEFASRICMDTDYDKCTLCGRCEYYCPTNAINVTTQQQGICTDCKICEDICPTGAIKNGIVDSSLCTLCLNCLNNCPSNSISIDDFKVNIIKLNQKINGSIISCLNCGLCADNNENGSLVKVDGNLRYDPSLDVLSDLSVENHQLMMADCPVSTLNETSDYKLEGYCVSCGKCVEVCQNDARSASVIEWDGKVSEDCISCGICVEVCPKDAITLKRGTIEVDLDKCIMCETCGIHCPKDAIPKRTTVKKEIADGFNMIDQQLCINCGLCQDICPEEAIIEKDGHLVVNEDDCIYCGACMHVCPSNAFLFERKFKDAK